MFRIFIATAFFSMFFSSPAHAYLDPGSGSMILQALAAAAMALAVFGRNLLAGFKRLFARPKARQGLKEHDLGGGGDDQAN